MEGIVMTVDKTNENTYDLSVRAGGKLYKSEWPGLSLDFCGAKIDGR
jgi:hypothetical protein